MWKFQDFSVILISCEIKVGESRNSKTAVFAISKALNFVDFANLSLQKYKMHKISKFRASKRVIMSDLTLLESEKLISRKIWVIEELWNFHTVSCIWYYGVWIQYPTHLHIYGTKTFEKFLAPKNALQLLLPSSILFLYWE